MATEFEQGLASIQRRRAIAQAMQEQALQPIQQQVSGTGSYPIVVKTSPWQVLGQLAQAYSAKKSNQKLDKEYAGIASQMSAAKTKALQDLMVPQDMAPAASSDEGPTHAPMGNGRPSAAQIQAAIDSGAAPEAIAAATKQDPNVSLGEGSTLVNSRTGQVVASGAPKPNFEQQKLDAAAKRDAETMRHNRASETNVAAGISTRATGKANDSDLDATAQLIATGRLAPPAAGSRSPTAIKLMGKVAQINPDYDASDFFNRKQSVTQFGSGKLGNTVRSLDVAVSHLDTLKTLGAALQNGDTPVFNSMSQYIAEQTGKPAPTNFDGVKSIVADEIAKAVIGGATALGDREELQKQVARSKSPEQLNGVIQSWMKLMGGQLNGLERQYKTSTKKDDFRTHLAKITVDQLEGEAPASPDAEPAGAPQQAEVTATGPNGQKLALRNGQWVPL